MARRRISAAQQDSINVNTKSTPTVVRRRVDNAAVLAQLERQQVAGSARANVAVAGVPRVGLGEIYPLDAPGMPPLGPDLLDFARNLDRTVVRTTDGAETIDWNNRTLRHLVRSLLYSFGDVEMPFTYKKQRRDLPVVSGHIWGDEPGDCRGPRPASVMVIGKMLGAEESRFSRNMAGNSAALFMDTCQDLQISNMRNWYVTNIIKTMHPDYANSGRNVSAAMIRAWLPLLHQEIRIVRPTFILCLGTDASVALLGYNAEGKKAKGGFHPSVSNMQGRVIEWKYPISPSSEGTQWFRTANVMAITHPAAVLAQPDQEPMFLNGLNRFAAVLRAGSAAAVEETDLDHRIVRTHAELLALRQEIADDCEGNLVALDAEWHGHHPQNDGAYLRTIQISWKHKTAACIRLRAPGGDWGLAGCTPTVAARLITDMCKGRRIAGHFFTADLEWLTPFGVDLRKAFHVPATWQGYMNAWRTGKPCGFDTGLAAHALCETDDFGLTAQTLQYTAAGKYDSAVDQWVQAHCSERKITKAELEGYGECPDDVLLPYSAYDADVTRRLAVIRTRQLFSDRNNMNCWEPFWISMRAQPAVLEMNSMGVSIDRKRMDSLTDLYSRAKDALLARVREWARWPELNLNSAFHVREFLFGEALNGKADPGEPSVRLRPPDAKSLRLTPILSTGKRPMPWPEVVQRHLQDQKTPGTNKLCLSLLAQESQAVPVMLASGERIVRDYSPKVTWIRDYRFISQVLRTTLRAPLTTVCEDSGETVNATDEDGQYLYDVGLPGSICSDGRVRTHFYQTKDTGRWSSARPPMQNLTKRREADYKRILGDLYTHPLRSILVASPGCVFVEADYGGAELYGMALLSGDAQLQADYLAGRDIHSQIAVLAFSLNCEPTKAGLKGLPNPKNPDDPDGLSFLRILAKSVIFGIAYGRGARAIALAAKEEGISITADEAQRVIDAVFRKYPNLAPYFERCRGRVLDPGWLCGAFGRLRRFPRIREESTLRDYERKAMNCPVQNLVADAISRSLDHMLQWRSQHPESPFRLLLQLHDAVLVETPYACAKKVSREMFPTCMVDRVPLHPTDLDGMPQGGGPYYLSADVDIYKRWSAKPKLATLQRCGFSEMADANYTYRVSSA